MSESGSNRILIGRIVGSFGIRGQVKVTPLTDFSERFAKGATVYLDGEPLVIRASQFHKTHYLLTFSEVPDKTAADKLQWKTLEAEPIEDLELEEDEFLSEDLVGLMVLTEDGRPLGKVDEVLSYPAHDILVVGKVMIPAVKEFVKNVDLDEGRMTVHLIDGMLEG